MNGFRVSFFCPANKIGTVLGLLYNEVTDLKMEQERNTTLPAHVNGTDRRHTPRKSPLYDFACAWVKANGAGFAFDTTPDGDLGRALLAGGHKASNSSPLVTMLTENGLVRRVGKGKAVTL